MYRTILLLLTGFFLLIQSSCQPRTGRIRSDPSTDHRGDSSTLVRLTAKEDIPPPVIALPTGTITLREALPYALMHNPDLKAYSFEVRAAEARALQAGLLPNPRLHSEVEEFGGKDERSGFESAEAGIALGQLIELGGKRDKRIHFASMDEEQTRWDFESVRLDVMLEVTQTYIGVLAAQERVDLSQKLLDLAQKAKLAVAQRVEAGKDPPVEELRASVALSKSEIGMKKALKALSTARRKFSAALGRETMDFDNASGDFYYISPVPTLNNLAEIVTNSPDLQRWAAEERKQRAAVNLEKAKVTSDVTVTGGIRYFEEGDDAAFVVGAALPIPLFNRNQGGVEEAMENLAKARQQYKAAQIKHLAALDVALNELAGTYDEVVALKNDVLTNAQKAFEMAYQGYEEGKFDYLYVLDTQRTLFETRAQYIDAVETYHQIRARVERLLGRGFDAIEQDQPVTGGPIQ